MNYISAFKIVTHNITFNVAGAVIYVRVPSVKSHTPHVQNGQLYGKWQVGAAWIPETDG